MNTKTLSLKLGSHRGNPRIWIEGNQGPAGRLSEVGFAGGKQMSTPAEIYWQTVATVSIRRLWSMRGDAMARLALRGWVRTLRQVTGKDSR